MPLAVTPALDAKTPTVMVPWLVRLPLSLLALTRTAVPR